MGFINENFMLHGKTAERLYHEYAEGLPIIDYHCHLSPKQIAENYRFRNAYDVFLGGDHYKWRLMRAFGIDERHITGDAPEKEKFFRFAEAMPYMIGNPVYHWTHLELKRYFGIDEPLSPKNAEAVWDKVNEMLERDDFRAQALILKSGVEVVCTTDDPADDLHFHESLKDFGVKILPAFRPDKSVGIEKAGWIDYIKNTGAKSYRELTDWLSSRMDYFDRHGCRLSDHGLDGVPYCEGDPASVFEKKMRGDAVTAKEAECFRYSLLSFCAKEYARRGWAMQLHIGALRNNNSVMMKKLGPDTGFDSINDMEVAENLSRLLDGLSSEGSLPKTILYCLNPKDNFVLATMAGNFQESEGVLCKMQFGAGWWYNDQRDGMEKQLRDNAALGLLGGFVGMLTDSRSFVSYPRHEYFRRILCNLIGSWVDNGEYPEDYDALGRIIRGICYENAKKYFGF